MCRCVKLRQEESEANLNLLLLQVWQHILHYASGLLSSISLPANTASVPMMHTAMKTQSRMWSKTMATNFHSSAAWNDTQPELREFIWATLYRLVQSEPVWPSLILRLWTYLRYIKTHFSGSHWWRCCFHASLSYIVRLLVWFHGLSDVLHSFDGTANVRVFHDGRLVRDTGWGWVSCKAQSRVCPGSLAAMSPLIILLLFHECPSLKRHSCRPNRPFYNSSPSCSI